MSINNLVQQYISQPEYFTTFTQPNISNDSNPSPSSCKYAEKDHDFYSRLYLDDQIIKENKNDACDSELLERNLCEQSDLIFKKSNIQEGQQSYQKYLFQNELLDVEKSTNEKIYENAVETQCYLDATIGDSKIERDQNNIFHGQGYQFPNICINDGKKKTNSFYSIETCLEQECYEQKQNHNDEWRFQQGKDKQVLQNTYYIPPQFSNQMNFYSNNNSNNNFPSRHNYSCNSNCNPCDVIDNGQKKIVGKNNLCLSTLQKQDILTSRPTYLNTQNESSSTFFQNSHPISNQNQYLQLSQHQEEVFFDWSSFFQLSQGNQLREDKNKKNEYHCKSIGQLQYAYLNQKDLKSLNEIPSSDQNLSQNFIQNNCSSLSNFVLKDLKNISETEFIQQEGEKKIYNSDKIGQSEQTHILQENNENSERNNNEIQNQVYHNDSRYPQTSQSQISEPFYSSQNPIENCIEVENQGVLHITPFSNEDIDQPFLKSDFDQNSKIGNNFIQQQNLTQTNLQINQSSDNELNIRQQIPHTSKKHNVSSIKPKKELKKKLKASININQSEHGIIEQSSNSQSSDNPSSMKATETHSPNEQNIIDQIVSLNKKNIVRNLVRAFKKYFLNKKSKPSIALQFFPDQSVEITQNLFKTYFVDKKFNNSILKQLITHPVYGKVFHHFILDRSSDYLDHSNIKAKESHEIFINFLELCLSNHNLLTHLETYSKL